MKRQASADDDVPAELRALHRKITDDWLAMLPALRAAAYRPHVPDARSRRWLAACRSIEAALGPHPATLSDIASATAAIYAANRELLTYSAQLPLLPGATPPPELPQAPLGWLSSGTAVTA